MTVTASSPHAVAVSRPELQPAPHVLAASDICPTNCSMTSPNTSVKERIASEAMMSTTTSATLRRRRGVDGGVVVAELTPTA